MVRDMLCHQFLDSAQTLLSMRSIHIDSIIVHNGNMSGHDHGIGVHLLAEDSLKNQEASHEIKEYLFFKQPWRETCGHT